MELRLILPAVLSIAASLAVNAAFAAERDFAALHWQKANDYASQKRWQQAMREVDKALALDGKCAEAFNARARIYNANKKYKLAIADAAECIKLKPKYAPAYSNRAYAEYRLQQFQQSVDDSTAALKIEPAAESYFYRAEAYNGLKKYREALNDLDHVINSQLKIPAMAEKIKSLLGLNEAKKARELADELLKTEPNWVEAYDLRADALDKLKKPADAAADRAHAKMLRGFQVRPAYMPPEDHP